MRVFIAVLVLIFSLQSWTKADDISDFEIEGISIGDSLLDYFSEEEIKSFYPIKYPGSNKIYGYEIAENSLATKSLKTFDTMGFHFKKDDKTYKIVNLKGIIQYPNNVEDCLKKKEEVVKEIRSILNNTEEESYKGDYGTGSSVAYITDFKQKDGQIRVWCTDWDIKTETEKRWEDDLNVSVGTVDFLNWINNEAY